MIFARSARGVAALAAGSALTGVALLVVAAVALAQLRLEGAAIAGAGVGVLALAAAGWQARRLRHWPAGRLGLFKDRLVVVEGRQQVHAAWEQMEIITLADQNLLGWEEGWPEVRLGNRLTLRMRNRRGSPRMITFHPADFGLAPAACRDLLIHLRDDAGARGRLPDFDSELDLAVHRVVSGELMVPRL